MHESLPMGGQLQAAENFARAVASYEVFHRLARLARRAVGTRAALVLLNDPAGTPRCLASSGDATINPSDILPDWLKAACLATVAGRGGGAVADFALGGNVNSAGAVLGWARACLSVPLSQSGEDGGTLMVLDDRSRNWCTEEIKTLQDLAWLSLDALIRESSQGDTRDSQSLVLFQKSLLESLTEASVDGILVVSNNGEVLLSNRRFVRLWRLPHDVVSTRNDENLLQAVNENIVDPEEFRARVAYLYQNPDEESRENIVLKDGRIFDRYSAPVKGDDGRRYGRVWFFRDISAQVQALRRVEELATELSSQQKWLEGLLDLLPVPVLLVDPHAMKIIFANKAADRFAGGSFPKLTLRPEPDVAPIVEALHEPADRAAHGEGLRGFQAEYRTNEGSKTLLVHSELFSERHGRHSVVVLAFDDVTELKRVQRELQQAVRVRDEFLSIASHELKTPVTALHLQIQSIIRATHRDGAKLAQDWLLTKVGRAETQVQRLTRLIDNLLDVSRITAGRLEFELEEIDLSQVAVEAAERLRDEAARVGTELRVREGEPVLGSWDRLRLEQVVTNLLTNALKYGGGKPVEMWVESLPNDRARLSVKDNGIGISEENQARIFERFERAVSERQYGGLGLGLWITRQIVEALQGTISVRSGPGEGSLFTVDLPKRATLDLDSSESPLPAAVRPS